MWETTVHCGEQTKIKRTHVILRNLYLTMFSTYISLTLYPRIAEVSQIFLRDDRVLPNFLAMSNTADVTGGKPIAGLLQSISGLSTINPLVVFYDIHGGKREVLFFFLSGHHTRLRLVLGCIFCLS
jgi:hypothetical protein